MSNIRVALAVAGSIVLCGSAWAEGTAGTTGDDLLRDCVKDYYPATPENQSFVGNMYCLGFLRAVWQMSEKGCGPRGVPMRNVAEIFIRYAKDHPEWLHRPAEEVVEAAIIHAFPCKPPSK